MRVLYLAHEDLSEPGAAAVHVHGFCEGLREEGHEVRLLLPRFPGRPLGHGRRVRGYPALRWPVVGPLSLFATLGPALDAQRADFRPDLLYYRQIGWAPWPALWARARRLPAVVEINGLIHRGWTASPARRAAYRRLERTECRAAVRVVTPSTAWRAELESLHALPPGRVVAVPNGVSVDRFAGADAAAARARRGFAPDVFVAGWFGRPQPWHRLDQLWPVVRAAASPRIRFLTVGIPPEEVPPDLRAGDRLRSEPACAPAGLGEALAAMDVSVATIDPAHLAGQFGAGYALKILESAAAGRAVVAWGNPDLARAVEAEGLGWGIAEDSPEKVAALLMRLASARDEVRDAGKRARSRVAAAYTWRQAVRIALEGLGPPGVTSSAASPR